MVSCVVDPTPLKAPCAIITCTQTCGDLAKIDNACAAKSSLLVSSFRWHAMHMICSNMARPFTKSSTIARSVPAPNVAYFVRNSSVSTSLALSCRNSRLESWYFVSSSRSSGF